MYLFTFRKNLASHIEQAEAMKYLPAGRSSLVPAVPLSHSYGYDSARDCPICLANGGDVALTGVPASDCCGRRSQRSESFVNYPGG